VWRMVSVVIPSYNSALTIRQCLESLQRQTYAGESEIILVDSSSDATPLIVAGDFPRVRLVHLDVKTDPGAARTLGVQRARGKIIAFIDADCVAAGDWLDTIVAAFADSCDAVGGAVLNGNSDGDLVGWAGYLAEFREFIPGRPRREVRHSPTCNIAYTKAVLDANGPFPGAYYPQEDLVYNHRLSEKGVKILWDPAIRVHHRHRSSLRAFLYHQHTIGAATARVLRVIDLPGSWIVRRPVAGMALVPLLPVVKWFNTVAAFLRYQPAMLLKRPPVLLVLGAGMLCWAGGFVREMLQETSAGK
jgi:glycosyltransferase involved in cell wall biosynthesis